MVRIISSICDTTKQTIDRRSKRSHIINQSINHLSNASPLNVALICAVLIFVNLAVFVYTHYDTSIVDQSINQSFISTNQSLLSRVDSNHWCAPQQVDVSYPPTEYDRSINTFTYPVTVTSAFFPANDSKHTMAEYSVWLSAFLSANQVPMVIFTSPEYYSVLASLRYRHIFVDSSISDFTLETVNNIAAVKRDIAPGRSLKEMRTHWQIEYSSPLDIPPLVPLREALQTTQRTLDPERERHTAHLYAVWNAKPFMLAWTAKHDPFLSKYFFWMDAGQMRDPMNDHYSNWPNVDQVARTFGESPHMPITPYVPADHPHPSRSARVHSRQHKMLIVIISVFPALLCPHLAKMDPSHITDVTLTRYNLVEGTNYGGTRHAVTWYERLYYDTMTMWESQSIFVGKDQSIQNAIYVAYPSSYLLLGAHNVGPVRHICGTEWFFFAQYLSHFKDRVEACPPENYDERTMVREGQTICDQPLDHQWIQNY